MSSMKTRIFHGVSRRLGKLPMPTRKSDGSSGPSDERPSITPERELSQKKRLIEKLERENAALTARLAGEGGEPERVKAGNVVWIFGSARTGSTWLSNMMGDLENHHVWNEPLVGNLFGYFFYGRSRDKRKQNAVNYIFAPIHKDVWLDSIKRFVLDMATARFPEAGEKGRVVVKEPNGSVGAPLLAEALPESRLIFLVRDFRDTVSSIKEANTEGNWLFEGMRRQGRRPKGSSQNPDNFIKARAESFMLNAGNAKKAHDAHTGPKTLVKYEDLRANTLQTMKRIYSEIGIPVDEGELARAVEKHAWENIPDEEKGEGKRKRKATPGAWKEDLSPEQVRIVEETAAPLMKQFYPDYPDPGHTI